MKGCCIRSQLKKKKKLYLLIDTYCPAMQFFSNSKELLGELVTAMIMHYMQMT